METFKVAHSTDNGAHEYFNGTNTLLLHGSSQISAFPGGLGQSQMVTEFFLTDGGGKVNLVSEDEEGSLGEFFDSEETLLEAVEYNKMNL